MTKWCRVVLDVLADDRHPEVRGFTGRACQAQRHRDRGRIGGYPFDSTPAAAAGRLGWPRSGSLIDQIGEGNYLAQQIRG